MTKPLFILAQKSAVDIWVTIMARTVEKHSGPQRVNHSPALNLSFKSPWLFKCSVFNYLSINQPVAFHPISTTTVCRLLPRSTHFSLWMCLLILLSAAIFFWGFLSFTVFSVCFSSLVFWLCMPLCSKWFKYTFTSVSLTNLL